MLLAEVSHHLGLDQNEADLRHARWLNLKNRLNITTTSPLSSYSKPS